MMKCYIDNNQNKKAISLYEQDNGKHNAVSNLLFMVKLMMSIMR